MARSPLHPGQVLLEEFMKPLGICPKADIGHTLRMSAMSRVMQFVDCHNQSVVPR